MTWAVGIVAIGLAVVVLAAAARRYDLSAPLVLIVAGIAASYLPFVPQYHLPHDVVLLGLLPPLLYATAVRTSAIDFRVNIRTIGYLSILLVVVTAGVVGLVVWAILPVPFAAAFAFGAVVAPPDAVAATAVARRVGLPRRLLTILEGESLVNDASAITCLRAGIAAMAGTATVGGVGGSFLWALLGGIAIGLVVAVLATMVRRRITSSVTDTAVSLLMPWLSYLPAESVHSSGVIAVVTTGLVLGHKSVVVQSAQSRIAQRINWTTVQFLLENAVFFLVGLQARWIVEGVRGSGLSTGVVVAFCAATFATVVVVRLVWVLAGQFLFRRVPGSADVRRPPLAWSIVIGWAGMRGVVTIAAALILAESAPYPDVFLLGALVVTAGTLLLLGPTLPLLVRALGVRGPSRREDALAAAEVLETIGNEALTALRGIDAGDDAREQVEQRIRRRTDGMWEQLAHDGAGETPAEEYRRLRLFTLGVEREAVVRMRSDGRVDQEVLSSVIDALDVEESTLESAQRRAETLDDERVVAPVRADLCEHLSDAPADPADDPPRDADHCTDCDRDGTTAVHLRVCVDCGHVACCDSSPGRHASRHSDETGHPVMRSIEPGESWRWCFVDQQVG